MLLFLLRCVIINTNQKQGVNCLFLSQKEISFKYLIDRHKPLFNIPKKPEIKLKEQAPDARMFAVIPIRAINDKRLTRGDLVNLMTLCSYCSKGGYTTVANYTMALYRGVSAPYISKGITKLEKLGYVEKVRGGYTGLRGALKRVIYDSNLRLKDVVSISNSPIQEEIMKSNRINKLAKQSNKPEVKSTKLNYEEAVLAVGSSLKSENDLLLLERLVSQGITHAELLAAFAVDNSVDKPV